MAFYLIFSRYQCFCLSPLHLFRGETRVCPSEAGALARRRRHGAAAARAARRGAVCARAAAVRREHHRPAAGRAAEDTHTGAVHPGEGR